MKYFLAIIYTMVISFSVSAGVSAKYKCFGTNNKTTVIQTEAADPLGCFYDIRSGCKFYPKFTGYFEKEKIVTCPWDISPSPSPTPTNCHYKVNNEVLFKVFKTNKTECYDYCKSRVLGEQVQGSLCLFSGKNIF